MIIFQTRETHQKEFEVGKYLRLKEDKSKQEIEKERRLKKEKKDQAIKDYEQKKKDKKPINEDEEVKNLGLDEFDFYHYLDIMGIDQGMQQALLEQQEDEH